LEFGHYQPAAGWFRAFPYRHSSLTKILFHAFGIWDFSICHPSIILSKPKPAFSAKRTARKALAKIGLRGMDKAV
jgi:hypothetical protein